MAHKHVRDNRCGIWEEYKSHCLVSSSIVCQSSLLSDTDSRLIEMHRRSARDIEAEASKLGLGATLTSHVRKGMQSYAKVASRYSESRSDDDRKRLDDIDDEMIGILG